MLKRSLSRCVLAVPKLKGMMSSTPSIPNKYPAPAVPNTEDMMDRKAFGVCAPRFDNKVVREQADACGRCVGEYTEMWQGRGHHHWSSLLPILDMT